MKLIDALRFSQLITESNIGDLIAELKKLQKKGEDIDDVFYNRAMRYINSSGENIVAILDKLSIAGIAKKGSNARAYKEISALCQMNPGWANDLDKVLSDRETNGFEMTEDTLYSNLIDQLSAKVGNNTELIFELNNVRPPLGGTSRGPSEILLGILGKDSNVNANQMTDEGKGDIIFNGKPCEIKQSGARIGSADSGGRLSVETVINKTRDNFQSYYNNIKEQFPKFDPTELYEAMDNGFIIFSPKSKHDIERLLIAPFKEVEFDQAKSNNIRKILIDTFGNMLGDFLTGDAKKFITPLIKTAIDELTKSRTLQVMINEDKIVADSVSLEAAIGAAYLLYYKSEEKFKTFLIASVDLKKAVLLSDKELDITSDNAIDIAKNLQSKYGIKFGKYRITSGARRGIIPLIEIK